MSSEQAVDWNVLTSPWLEVLNFNAVVKSCSPLEALEKASGIRCIVAPSPLDLFAAHRFLLTLLYWKAEVGGDVQQVRESLLRRETPRIVVDAIKAEAPQFCLFADDTPFLQDPLLKNTRQQALKSAGSLFAEFASGINIAHFHHGDDDSMRICLRCATVGMLRVVPWTQSGGAGLSPAVHNAPPIMAMALGANLAITLGLNLVSVHGEAGEAKWSGHFVPTARDSPIPYLEAFTWNPRRIHLLRPQSMGRCWACGQDGIPVVGPIAYQKNEETQTRKDRAGNTIPFTWQDPSAFYPADAPHTPRKSLNEANAATSRDLDWLLDGGDAANAQVVLGNPNHQEWCLVIPCTTGKDKKTFDHRKLHLAGFSPDAVRLKLPAHIPVGGPQGLDGWLDPQRSLVRSGAVRFVQSAAQLLTYADWAILSNAAYREMHDSPAAFDMLSNYLKRAILADKHP